MGGLADEVLPLIRTRAEVWRWNVANEHGSQMQEAVAILRDAAKVEDPSEVLAVTQKAIASATKVILRADDSSGVIGDAVFALLVLHADVATQARPPAAKLVAWMLKLQLETDFSLDPVAYAPALGPAGIELYRGKVQELSDRIGPESSPEERWTAPDAHERHVLEHNLQRLAVHDRDVDAIVRTHARDRRVAAWLEDTAKAFEEIGEIELALDWAKQAAELDSGFQSQHAGAYWCELLARHRPDELLPACLWVFRRWPTTRTAERVHEAAGSSYPTYHDEVFERLAAVPHQAVLFALLTLGDPGTAWELAHSLRLKDADTWTRVVKEYEKLDPLGVLPVLRQLVEGDLEQTDPRSYQVAARRLKRMRQLAAGSPHVTEVDAFVLELRERYRRRPRLQQELDRAGLPRVQ